MLTAEQKSSLARTLWGQAADSRRAALVAQGTAAGLGQPASLGGRACALYLGKLARGWKDTGLGRKLKARYPAVVAGCATMPKERLEDMKTLPPKASAVGELVKDLEHLEREFSGVRWDGAVLTVETEPISLYCGALDGDVLLGRFAIELTMADIPRRGSSTAAYRVVPLDAGPRPDGYPHPHVQESGIVCEGDGMPAITKALADGRIGDFFELVAGVLRTYNPESPYRRLEKFTEEDTTETCGCCRGEYDREEEGAYCEGCDHDVCGECSEGCCDCATQLCRSCRYTCADCSRWVCDDCVTRCQCGEERCGSCAEKAGRPCSRCEAEGCTTCEEGGCVGCGAPLCGGCLEEHGEWCKPCEEARGRGEPPGLRAGLERHTPPLPLAGEDAVEALAS